MDIEKLFEKVINNEEMQSVPLKYIFKVFICVLDAISSGECFYINE